jgi:hypothetical protein
MELSFDVAKMVVFLTQNDSFVRAAKDKVAGLVEMLISDDY